MGSEFYKKLNLGRFLALCLIAVFLVISLGKLWRSRNVFGQGGRANLVIQDPLAVVSYDLNSRQITYFLISADAQIIIPHGGGTISAKNFPKFVGQEKRGMDFAKDAVMITLGIGIDAAVGKDAGGLGYGIEGEGVKARGIWQRLKEVEASGLTWKEKIALFRLVSGVGTPRVKVVGLSDAGLFDEHLQPDNNVVKQVDLLRSLQFFYQKIRDEQIVDENVTVTVLNGTQTPLLARLVGTILRSSGIRVIREGQGESRPAKCLINARPELKGSHTLSRLQGWLGCDFSSNEVHGRSDMTVVLGEGFAGLVGEAN